MPPVRTSTGRAAKACTSCRARKTRCYESPGSIRSCLRCSTLRLKCSLTDDLVDEAIVVEEIDPSIAQPPPHVHNCAKIEQRLGHLESTVERLSRALESGSVRPSESVSHQRPNNNLRTLNRVEQAAPLLVIRDAVSSPEQTVDKHTHATIPHQGSLTTSETISLLVRFRQHCGRWIAVDETTDEPLQIESPLLRCACCLIALRHSNSNSSPDLATSLFAEAKAMLGEQLMTARGDVEFFQAVLILSLWSTTIGQEPFSVDSWLITGIAIQHDIALRASGGSHVTMSAIDAHRAPVQAGVWTHLCLSHLHACISMRRQSMLTRADVDSLHVLVMHDHATNFQTRMVAEVLLYWIIYQECVGAEVVLPRGQAALKRWKSDWSFLFDQPRHHFLQMSFAFAQLLMYEQCLQNKSAAVRESLVSQMLQLCSDIVRLAMDTDDERTPYLTDHIYHILTFAGVTLCRLLNKYEGQLKVTHDIEEMDILAIRIAQWLQAIGSDCHIGNILGKTVMSVHRQLRPEKHATSPSVVDEHHPTENKSAIPDFLAMDAVDVDWDEILHDWDLLTSGEPSQPDTNTI